MGANIAADSLSSMENFLWFKDEAGEGDLVTNEKYCHFQVLRQNEKRAVSGPFQVTA
ncbi:hypothetical protein [Pseudomonas sp. UV AK001]|uniref:hypothetical protein n=1 Tax=Pseudomonas sp. UV AK001 TaxID=3384791 RepID=UPI0038D3C883